MAETTTITIRVPIELKAKLDRLGDLTKRSRSYLAAEAVEIYTRYELEIVEGVLEGIADVEAGRVFTAAQVKADMESLLTELKAKAELPTKKAVGS